MGTRVRELPPVVHPQRMSAAVVHTFSFHASPIGRLLLRRSGMALSGLWFADSKHAPSLESTCSRDDGGFEDIRLELDEYFAGTRREFSIPVVFTGGTAFQRLVWGALSLVPFGESQSYAELAAQIGRPKSVRAVGTANGQNPISIVVPCHRLVGSHGELRGYAGGLEAKAWLLRHEHEMFTSPSSESLPSWLPS
eukprot:c5523_g1_i1.p3 GENE.c5523_g1_i1~~c5523_g1_i1.p3  ORF type:complete len:195 (-),score=23.05 c5523_g1_i1:27-611(-)